MTPKDILVSVIDPANALLASLTKVRSDDRARVLMMAIAGQESAWEARVQAGGGPAHGLWQFERGGGVAGVFRVLPKEVELVCADLGVPYGIDDVYVALVTNDVLAACMARLLLWSDPAALPAVGDVQTAWAYYLRNWRPGAPHPDVWPARYGTAMGLVQSARLYPDHIDQLRSSTGVPL